MLHHASGSLEMRGHDHRKALQLPDRLRIRAREPALRAVLPAVLLLRRPLLRVAVAEAVGTADAAVGVQGPAFAHRACVPGDRRHARPTHQGQSPLAPFLAAKPALTG